jgi:hypothetical protein
MVPFSPSGRIVPVNPGGVVALKDAAVLCSFIWAIMATLVAP